LYFFIGVHQLEGLTGFTVEVVVVVLLVVVVVGMGNDSSRAAAMVSISCATSCP